MLRNKRIAFIGAGAMGEALAGGLVRARVVDPANLVMSDIDVARLNHVAAQLQVATTTSNSDAVAGADLVLLAVKPQQVESAMTELGACLIPNQSLISICAGVKTSNLEAFTVQPVPVVRVMPNTPAFVGQAASAICLGKHAKEEHRQAAHAIFDAVGLAVDCEEKLLDAVTGLSGSGPAYIYLLIEALSDAGVEQGLPRPVATALAAQTVLGAAQMVLQTKKHPGELKDMVTSPGGTTIHGLHALERGGFRAAVMDAVAAATKRSKELG